MIYVDMEGVGQVQGARVHPQIVFVVVKTKLPGDHCK